MAERDTAQAIIRHGRIEEQRFCWNAHQAHNTYEQVAVMATAHFGRPFSRSAVHRRIEAERNALRAEIRKHAEDELADMIAELDGLSQAAVRQAARMQQIAEDAAASGMFGMHEKAEAVLNNALGRLVQIQERRAKLLGLDAAVRVEHSGTVEVVDGEAAELARILDAAAQHSAAERERANDAR
jgi:hypothetical protein